MVGTETDFVTDFYEDLAPLYHLVHEDWESSIRQQAEMLDSIFRERWGKGGEILDVSCGIGTQALGLAARGYDVTASDLTAGAVARARNEAASHGLKIDFSVADMRRVFDHHGRQFDVVLSGDNSVPHLLSDEEILHAFRQFHACTKIGGGCVVSVRDYDAEDSSGNTTIKLFGTRVEPEATYVVFQKWDWDGSFYDLSMYFVADRGEPQCTTHVMRSRYYAIGLRRLCELMTQAGFADVSRIDGEFFQPLIVGTRAA